MCNRQNQSGWLHHMRSRLLSFAEPKNVLVSVWWGITGEVFPQLDISKFLDIDWYKYDV